MRTWKIILATLALTAALTGCQTGSQQAEAKYISMEQAQSNALHAAQIDAADAVVSSTMLEETHGITCYKVEFTANDSVYTYSVHAETGEIIEASFRDADSVGGVTDQTQDTAADASSADGNQTSTATDSATTMLPAASSVQNAPNSVTPAEGGGKTTAPAAQPSGTARQITESAAKDAALKHAGVKKADLPSSKRSRIWKMGVWCMKLSSLFPVAAATKSMTTKLTPTLRRLSAMTTTSRQVIPRRRLAAVLGAAQPSRRPVPRKRHWRRCRERQRPTSLNSSWIWTMAAGSMRVKSCITTWSTISPLTPTPEASLSGMLNPSMIDISLF